tara:strand:- start:72 stop:383 length:312 start_codon:yes stop_codon:yes gene_type:complete
MLMLRDYGLHPLLCDDMGLGKTIQGTPTTITTITTATTTTTTATAAKLLLQTTAASNNQLLRLTNDQRPLSLVCAGNTLGSGRKEVAALGGSLPEFRYDALEK